MSGKLDRYMQELADLSNEVSFDNYYAIIQKKILQYLAQQSVLVPDLHDTKVALIKLFKPTMGEFLTDIFKTFENVIEMSNTVYIDMGNDISRNLGSIIAMEQITQTKLGQYSERAATKMSTTIRNGLTEGKGISDIKSDLITVGGKVRDYADAIAKTQVVSYGRACEFEKAKSARIITFEYAGIVRNTTREWCAERVGRAFTLNEINEMEPGRGQPTPVMIYGGGYRCHHRFRPKVN